MTENNNKMPKKYFGAANTYRGFISYFDRIFNSPDYERLYVIKGGPGTGKSSLMRKISKFFSEKNLDVEEIYCSSDPGSLDGVIISSDNKKIAILDGTAPHERDAKIPGAIDEIINLANGLDKRWIRCKREDILSLSKEKTEAYKSAYNYLSLAGSCAGIIYESYNEHFDEFKAKSKAESIFENFTFCYKGKITTRFISSFSRYGQQNLNSLSALNSRNIKVRGDKISAGLFMNICYSILRSNRAEILNFPYCLDPSVSEAMYLPKERLIISYGADGEIDADDFVSLQPLHKERIKIAKQIHSDALEEARRWFAIASDIHFRLEKIYGEAMNFEFNDRIIEEKITEIANILEITI